MESKLNNEKVNTITTTIVRKVMEERAPIMIEPSKEKETVELTINAKAQIFVHSHGIKISATTTVNNKRLGLEPLDSDKSRCNKDYGFSDEEVAKVVNTVLNID